MRVAIHCARSPLWLLNVAKTKFASLTICILVHLHLIFMDSVGQRYNVVAGIKKSVSEKHHSYVYVHK